MVVSPRTGLELRVQEGPDAGRVAAVPRSGLVRVGGSRGDDLVLTDRPPSAVTVELAPGGAALRASVRVWLGAVGIDEGVVPVGARLRVGDHLVAVERTQPPEDLRARLADEGLVYADPTMDRVATAIAEVAPYTMSVLVQGETGTGKEVVARAIHGLSLRAGGPFVVVDCGALPRTLVESELFGHERGAFTGAATRRRGAFERAHGGTLFLDEIGELPRELQPMLLGVLQRKRLRRVGGDDEVPVDTRIVAATHRDLGDDCASGRFREDLFYRLATVRVEIPPLRERPADVHAIASRVFDELTGQPGRGPLDEATWRELLRRPWPGNVRELRAALERVLATGRLDLDAVRADAGRVPPDALAPPLSTTASSDEEGASRYRDARAEALAAFERRFLGALMDRCEGNASRAAREAEMDRPYLLRLLRRHHLR
ncbi:MAG: sigma-54 dependent transcriptional regulator [Myxococcota bacterium]